MSFCALQACEQHEQRAAQFEDGMQLITRTMEQGLAGYEGRASDAAHTGSIEHESAAFRKLNATMHQLMAKVHSSQCHP